MRDHPRLERHRRLLELAPRPGAVNIARYRYKHPQLARLVAGCGLLLLCIICFLPHHQHSSNSSSRDALGRERQDPYLPRNLRTNAFASQQIAQHLPDQQQRQDEQQHEQQQHQVQAHQGKLNELPNKQIGQLPKPNQPSSDPLQSITATDAALTGLQDPAAIAARASKESSSNTDDDDDDRPEESPSISEAEAASKAHQQQIAVMTCSNARWSAAPRRVLVTGAAGFIGMHVSLALVQQGDAVLGLDNLSGYYSVSLKKARRTNLEQHSVHVIRGDVNDAALLGRLFLACGFTHVVHLAGQPGVRSVPGSDARAYVSSNVQGTLSLLEAVRAARRQPAFLLASSSSVYGASERLPFSETDAADEPTSLYAASKRSAELLARAYHSSHNVSTTILRFFSVYGPWGRPDMAYIQFAHAILAGKPVRVFKTADGGEMQRDFTYVADLVSGVLGAMKTSEPSAAGQSTMRVFNLGSSRPISVAHMADVLAQQLGRKLQLEVEVSPSAGELRATQADISAAEKALGYKAGTSLEQGLHAFAEWYVDYYGRDLSKHQEEEGGKAGAR
jgi:UDP-glucuronate 4-epimerase